MPRPVAKDYDDKRRHILTRASALFAEQGFDRASVSQVAKACAISKANIYHYYSSKDDILFDILDAYLSGLRDRICGMDLTGMSAEQAFRVTMTEVLLAYQGADNEHRLQSSSVKHLSEDQQTVLVAYQRDLVAHASTLIQALAPDVFVDNRGKLRSVTMSVFGMLNWFYMWNGGADEAERRRYAELVCDMCLGGVQGL